MLYRVIKRGFDILASLLAMIVSSPLWLVAALGIKLSSKGPVFYRAERIGKNFKPFTLNKFRSMHVPDPEEVNHEKKFMADEHRVFKFGAFLRKSKLDELPQLLNIFCGQMSVVGPRPMSEKGARKYYVGDRAVIATVRPGLACLDSLYDYAHGELFVTDEEVIRTKIFPVRAEMARIYVENRSIGLDLSCIFRTVKLIFQIVVQKRKKFPYTKYEREAVKKVLGTEAEAE